MAKHYLVIRFSAMGDVLLSLPVLAQAAAQNPDDIFILITRPKFAPYFSNYSNIIVETMDVDVEYRNFYRFFSFVKKIKQQYPIDACIDLHDSLRSRWLRLLFAKKTFVIDKGRKEKKLLTRKKNKKQLVLKHITERYAEVFYKAGLQFKFQPYKEENYFRGIEKPTLEKTQKWIGYAPFAKHKGKRIPKEKRMALLEQLLQLDATIFLFSSREEGGEFVQVKQNNFYISAEKFSAKEELAIISNLDIMICTDSANMHLASIAGVPTISFWGATHSNLGFGALHIALDKKIEVALDTLACRPCSVFGNKKCYRGDYACWQGMDYSRFLENL